MDLELPEVPELKESFWSGQTANKVEPKIEAYDFVNLSPNIVNLLSYSKIQKWAPYKTVSYNITDMNCKLNLRSHVANYLSGFLGKTDLLPSAGKQKCMNFCIPRQPTLKLTGRLR